MRRYHGPGMQLRLKRVESGLHQNTLGTLLGGATQALVSWWESGRYLPGDCCLNRIYQFLGLDPMALRVYVLASGLQPRRRNGHKTKASSKNHDNGGSDWRDCGGFRTQSQGAAERNDENADSSDEQRDIASRQGTNEMKGEAAFDLAFLSGREKRHATIAVDQ